MGMDNGRLYISSNEIYKQTLTIPWMFFYLMLVFKPAYPELLDVMISSSSRTYPPTLPPISLLSFSTNTTQHTRTHPLSDTQTDNSLSLTHTQNTQLMNEQSKIINQLLNQSITHILSTYPNHHYHYQRPAHHHHHHPHHHHHQPPFICAPD